ncbi:MAG: hypothetical protein K9I85_06330 [Saprospiraceae bacterium]|nr:hypothetical protein [Saprospiraceae bacterium]
MEKGICFLTNKEYPLDDLVQGLSLKPQLVSLIQKDYPEFSSDKFISLDILNT